MTIHLIRTSGFDLEAYIQVYDLLSAVDGSILFKCDTDYVVDFSDAETNTTVFRRAVDFETKDKSAYHKSYVTANEFPLEVATVSWKTLFEKCDQYRRLREIPESEFVFLLTETGNAYNWFASLDVDNPINGFIHTADWEYYLSCPRQFPIAYEVIALLLHKYTFNEDDSLESQVHNKAIGCVSDMCMEKGEIILKMRTADVCGECMTKLKQRMPMHDIIHALNIMDSLRVKMLYAQNFKQHVELSEVYIDPRNNKIYLPGFSNIEIKLRPLEKALYFLFMRHPNGLFLSDLPDHREELVDIYEQISHTGTRTEMRERINDLVNVLSNSASEKISRIKRAFEEAIGADLAKHYYIQGGNGERKRVGG